MLDTPPSYPKQDRNRVRRLHERAVYDRSTVFEIIDACPLAHIGYSLDGQPFVTPTFVWRQGEELYWHGSAASRMLKGIRDGAPVCVTFTIFDGYVLARSAFNSSANYRTVLAFGHAQSVPDAAGKDRALAVMLDQLLPGRRAEIRENSAKEPKATTVVRMPIEDAVAKVRGGPPEDDEEDYAAATCWAGVIPRRDVYDPPERCPRLDDAVVTPQFDIGRRA